MNSSVYIFGRLGNGYTQYPDDYAKEVYQNFCTRATAGSQIIIHRDNNLMYYGYIRKLDADAQYIGFCILLNGVVFSQISRLFLIFENAVTNLVSRGEILAFNSNGDIYSPVNRLNETQQEVKRVISMIRSEISVLESNVRQIPSVSYGVSNKESKSFLVDDKDDDIVEASSKYGYTSISKDNDYDTTTLSNYKSVLKKVHSEKEAIINDYDGLKKAYDQLNEQKKQYKKVVLLCLLIVLCSIGLFFLKDSLDSTINNLEYAQMDITEKTVQITNLQSSLSAERSNSKRVERELSKLKTTYGSYIPAIITDVEIANIFDDGSVETDYGGVIYSSSSMYLKPQITYEGVAIGDSITLHIKLYTPSGLGSGSSSLPDCSWTESFYVYGGSNTQSFRGWGSGSKGNWVSGVYRYEFWYDNVCLKAKSFTVH